MLKSLLLLAVTANVFYIVSSTADSETQASSRSSSTRTSGNTYSSSSSSSSSYSSGCSSSDEEEYTDYISCGGDPNAMPGCDAECRKRCPSRKTLRCSCPKKNSCECKEGYVFDYISYKCVRPEKCPPTCGNTEEYSDCTNGGCQAKNCSQKGKPIPCVKIDPKYCIKGCLCKKDYLRTDDGDCVPEEQCPLQCPKPHQVYDSCPPTCPPQICESINRKYNCPLQSANKSLQHCKPDCVCEKGYYKNKIEECISKDDCLKCTGPNEYFSCGGACDNVCATLHEQNQTNCPINNIVCNEMCYCEKGYARDKKNMCIPISECDVCGENEVTSDCVNGGCDKRNCSQLGQPDICIDPLNCIKGCVCKKGYLRNNEDVCVSIEKCPPVCGKNEVYNDCIEGQCQPINCSQVGYPVPCPTIDPKDCTGGCTCKDGYVKAKNGTCIPKNQCPSCGGDPNARAGCGVNCNKHCSDIGKEPRGCIKICYPNACDCKDKYVLDNNTGKCVLPKQCTPVCGKDEVYNSCIQGQCSPKNCSQLGNPISCPRIDPKYCIKGCLCKDGYLRADNGTCILKENCPSCGGDPNARAGCGINCNKHCSDIGKKPGACIDLCKENACDCKDKYVLDNNTGKCVLPKQCTPVCGEDEVYNSCIQGQCSPKNCSQLGNPILCPRIDPKYCIKGCLCKDGYLRADNGTCILKENCPSCGGDPNARAGCGINCNKHCSDIGKEPGACIDLCKGNACDCKDKYVLDDNTGKCVLPKQCTPVCGEDEVYNSCIQGQCSPKNCSQLGNPISCPRIDPKYCIKGCLCKDGYLRAENGTCILKENCPSCGGDPNARSGCGVNCNKRCSDIGKEPGACIAMCYDNACDCKDGYILDDNSGKCVLPDKCSPTSTTITTTPAPPIDIQDSLERLRLGNLKFSAEMLYQLLQSQPEDSFVLSAISALIPIGQLALYSVGETLNQLLGVLNLRNKDEIKAVFPEVVKNYGVQMNVTLEQANKIYGNVKYPFSSPFIDDSTYYLDAEVENIDFSHNVEAADTINKWVENKTHNQIQNLVSPDMLSENTQLAMINAIYFLGNWQHQFNSNLTEDKDFYVTPNKTKSIRTMYQQGTFNYGESDYLDAQVLEMLYKGGNMSLMTFLPRQKDGLSDMTQKLGDPNKFLNSMNSLKSETVKIYYPLMNISMDINMEEQLKKNNVTEMFNPQSDGFRGMLKKQVPVYISAARQKDKIKVDETGTEAAVATVVVGLRATAVRVPTEEYSFIADHGFVFCILLQRDPMFCGVFVG